MKNSEKIIKIFQFNYSSCLIDAHRFHLLLENSLNQPYGVFLFHLLQQDLVLMSFHNICNIHFVQDIVNKPRLHLISSVLFAETYSPVLLSSPCSSAKKRLLYPAGEFYPPETTSGERTFVTFLQIKSLLPP